MDKFLSYFSRLWSDNAQGMRKRDIEVWARTEYSNDWEFAYNYYISSGKMPKAKDIKGIKNV